MQLALYKALIIVGMLQKLREISNFDVDLVCVSYKAGKRDLYCILQCAFVEMEF